MRFSLLTQEVLLSDEKHFSYLPALQKISYYKFHRDFNIYDHQQINELAETTTPAELDGAMNDPEDWRDCVCDPSHTLPSLFEARRNACPFVTAPSQNRTHRTGKSSQQRRVDAWRLRVGTKQLQDVRASVLARLGLDTDYEPLPDTSELLAECADFATERKEPLVHLEPSSDNVTTPDCGVSLSNDNSQTANLHIGDLIGTTQCTVSGTTDYGCRQVMDTFGSSVEEVIIAPFENVEEISFLSSGSLTSTRYLTHWTTEVNSVITSDISFHRYGRKVQIFWPEKFGPYTSKVESLSKQRGVKVWNKLFSEVVTPESMSKRFIDSYEWWTRPHFCKRAVRSKRPGWLMPLSDLNHVRHPVTKDVKPKR